MFASSRTLDPESFANRSKARKRDGAQPMPRPNPIAATPPFTRSKSRTTSPAQERATRASNQRSRAASPSKAPPAVSTASRSFDANAAPLATPAASRSLDANTKRLRMPRPSSGTNEAIRKIIEAAQNGGRAHLDVCHACNKEIGADIPFYACGECRKTICVDCSVPEGPQALGSHVHRFLIPKGPVAGPSPGFPTSKVSEGAPPQLAEQLLAASGPGLSETKSSPSAPVRPSRTIDVEYHCTICKSKIFDTCYQCKECSVTTTLCRRCSRFHPPSHGYELIPLHETQDPDPSHINLTGVNRPARGDGSKSPITDVMGCGDEALAGLTAHSEDPMGNAAAEDDDVDVGYGDENGVLASDADQLGPRSPRNGDPSHDAESEEDIFVPIDRLITPSLHRSIPPVSRRSPSRSVTTRSAFSEPARLNLTLFVDGVTSANMRNMAPQFEAAKATMRSIFYNQNPTIQVVNRSAPSSTPLFPSHAEIRRAEGSRLSETTSGVEGVGPDSHDGTHDPHPLLIFDMDQACPSNSKEGPRKRGRKKGSTVSGGLAQRSISSNPTSGAAGASSTTTQGIKRKRGRPRKVQTQEKEEKEEWTEWEAQRLASYKEQDLTDDVIAAKLHTTPTAVNQQWRRQKFSH